MIQRQDIIKSSKQDPTDHGNKVENNNNDDNKHTQRLPQRSQQDSGADSSINRAEMLRASQQGWTSSLVIACLIVTASCSFSFGYGIGAPNMYAHFTEPFLRGQYGICDVDSVIVRQAHNCSMHNNNPFPLTVTTVAGVSVPRKGSTSGSNIMKRTKSMDAKFDAHRELINGLPQTMFILGCFLGSLTGSMWNNLGSWWTRRNVFFVNLPFTYVAAAFILLSQYFRVGALFYISRLLHGYQSGMACAIVPPYVNEISSQKVRGSAGVLHQCFVTIGILCAQIFGLPVVLGRYQYWSIGLSLMVIPCIVANVALMWSPQSPAEMFLKFNKVEEAKKALQKLRNRKNVSADLLLLEQERVASCSDCSTSNPQSSSSLRRQSKVTLSQLFKGTFRWPMITSLTLLSVQALCGINAVFFYSGKIFKTAGISDAYLQYASAGTGLINVLVTVVAIYLIERLGRRPLIIYPMLSMLVTFILLTVCVQLNERHHSAAIGAVSVVLTLIFICAFAVGIGPIAFLYPNEVFRLEGRDLALRIGLCFNYIGNLLLSLCFPVVNAALRGYVFLIFFAIVALGSALLWFKLPETKNKSIDEIERFWYKRSIGSITIPVTRSDFSDESKRMLSM